MSRLLLSLAAVVALPAAASAATYSVKTSMPIGTRHVIARDIAWTCAADSCRVSTAASRPLLLCQSLAKKVGRIEQFAVEGQPLDAADLGKCNLSARGGAPAALAAQ